MDPTTGAVLAVGLIAFLGFLAFIAYLVTLNKECCNMPDNTQLKEAIAGVQAGVTAIAGDVTGIGAGVAQIQTDVAELKARIVDQIAPEDLAALEAIESSLATAHTGLEAAGTALVATGADIDTISVPEPPPVP